MVAVNFFMFQQKKGRNGINYERFKIERNTCKFIWKKQQRKSSVVFSPPFPFHNILFFLNLYLPCMLVCKAVYVDLYASYAKRFTVFCYYVVIEECGIL